MRCFLSVFLLCLTKSFCWAQHTIFTIKGRISENSEAKKVFLQGDKLQIEIPVSARKDFYYEGSVSTPQLCRISTDKTKGAIPLWITRGDISIALEEYNEVQKDSIIVQRLNIHSITGPPETEKYHWFLKQTDTASKRFPAQTSFSKFRDSMAKYYDPLIEEYILLHPNSKFSYYVSKLAFGRENIKKYLSLINKGIGGEEGSRLTSRLKQDSVTKEGLVIGDFKMKTVSGKMFSLQNDTSTYILLEFWAHDCYPCRAQHPALVKIYNLFKPKGFEIIGVALDDSKRKWRSAIGKDNIPWIQVSDLKGWDNFLAKRYFVESIPFNILIDKNKRIIATGMSPKALDDKLKELFSK